MRVHSGPGSSRSVSVSVPVKVFSAISEHRLEFHLIHEPDGSPIGYQKVCKVEGKPVPDDEVVKAFELRKGEFVKMTDEDFELARSVGADRTIEITDFVPGEDIDALFFAKPYYVGPGNGGDHVYALLAKAMEDSGLAAVVTFVMRDRRHLGALRVHEGVLVLEQLHFADELRPLEGIAPTNQRVSKQEARDGGQAHSVVHREVEAREIRGHLPRRAVCPDQGEASREGSRLPEARDEAWPTDLMEALRRSVRASSSAARPRRTSPSKRGSPRAALLAQAHHAVASRDAGRRADQRRARRCPPRVRRASRSLAGAESYAARAFRRGGDLIAAAPVPVADLVRSGRVRELRGIGSGIEARLRELIETGRLAEVEDLRRETSP